MQKGYGPPISEVPGGSFEEIYPEKNEKFPRTIQEGCLEKKLKPKTFGEKFASLLEQYKRVICNNLCIKQEIEEKKLPGTTNCHSRLSFLPRMAACNEQ